MATYSNPSPSNKAGESRPDLSSFETKLRPKTGQTNSPPLCVSNYALASQRKELKGFTYVYALLSEKDATH